MWINLKYKTILNYSCISLPHDFFCYFRTVFNENQCSYRRHGIGYVDVSPCGKIAWNSWFYLLLAQPQFYWASDCQMEISVSSVPLFQINNKNKHTKNWTWENKSLRTELSVVKSAKVIWNMYFFIRHLIKYS